METWTLARKSNLTALALTTITALLLSGCSGGSDTETAVGAEKGFQFGAPQNEVNKAISDLEPVTLTYQPGATSPDSPLARVGFDFKEAVEQRSNGQITIDLVWGQAIAGHSEMAEAVADGRVDIADYLPVYRPDEFPTYNALSTALAGLPNSPVLGELIHVAVAAELGEQNEALHAEFETQGMTPMAPFISAGAFYHVCRTEDTSVDDWNGNLTRISSTSHHKIAENMGTSPTSLEWAETYEAMQRGTIDCTITQLHTAAEAGVTEVAPHIMYTSAENALPSRVAAAEVVGPTVKALPLPYQQIIHDAYWVEGYAAQVNASIEGKSDAVTQVKNAGGSIVPLEEDVDEVIGAANEELVASLVERDFLSEEIIASIPALTEKWETRIRELGFEDAGTLEDMDEWWDSESQELTDFTRELFQEVGLENRPQ